ncbi:MAG: recombinase family protein, partial [Deltaproteobacteria bacterium]|nr:recombinase family protein [Deltaproteobacteria bacterium]
MKPAGIYARVSSDRQREEHTIESQVAALVEYSEKKGFIVPNEWIFKDEGYSGSSLVRPGLERVRDLASEGQIETLLIHSPDRLSRKYAYQVLLVEEFGRNGVEVVFIKSPKASTPEEELLLQFQGMIAEYERAQIIERSRRGKRHRARLGSVNVLSGAPYGYLYVKKTEGIPAYYKIIEKEAEVVRQVYKLYTEDCLSIADIVRYLNEKNIPTRKRISKWERTTIWAMLKNPAYKGTACYGKTKTTERQKITRPLRKRGGYSPRCSSNVERPKEDWIEIPVPAIVSEKSYFLAEERLEENKRYSKRRTKEPTLLQGMIACNKCGYAYYRISTRTSLRNIYYYRCLGSDNYRYANGAICDSKAIRQDYLDRIVWEQVLKLLENPELIRAELKRRIKVIRDSSPVKQKKDDLKKQIIRTNKAIYKLLDAYQEDLIQLDELRSRMPELRKREKSLNEELNCIESDLVDQRSFLKVAENMESFLSTLRRSAETMNVTERQKVLRLIVKEILIDDENIIIKHSIPLPQTDMPIEPILGKNIPSYLLRKGS